MMTFIPVESSGKIQQEAFRQSKELIQQIKTIKETAIKNTNLAICILNKQLQKFLIKLRVYQCDLRKIRKKLLFSKYIDISTIKNIKEHFLGFKSINKSDSEIMQTFRQLFDFELAIRIINDEDCENALVFIIIQNLFL
jgi:hypothetical protein